MSDDEKKPGKLLVLPVAPHAAIDAIVDLPPVSVRAAWHDHLTNPERCHHPSVVIHDGRDRHVRCKTCDRELDPISILIDYAHADRHILCNLEHVREARASAQKETEEIRKGIAALRKQRHAAILKDPLLRALADLKKRAAAETRGHSDEDVVRLRQRIRWTVDGLIDQAMQQIAKLGAEEGTGA